jgi:hypothetical protein
MNNAKMLIASFKVLFRIFLQGMRITTEISGWNTKPETSYIWHSVH